MRCYKRIGILLLLGLTGCSSPAGSGNPCANVDCGDHGQCQEQNGAAICACDPGFHMEGATCVANTDAAVPAGCGNGVAESGEVCDGVDLRGETCVSQGFGSGILDCAADCERFDTAGCDTTCGDGLMGGTEQCDTDDLAGASCQSLGYSGGALTCQLDCTFDLSACDTAVGCGDGVIQTGDGEQCDSTDLAGSSCQDQGFYSGTLTCDASCLFDVSACVGECGDGVVQPAQEDCDGSDLDGETCVSQGFIAGVLACDGSCAFDTGACVSADCGNGSLDGTEACDDGNTQSNDGCDASCQVEAGYECSGEPSICTLLCGNGQIDGAEACDGTDFGTDTCLTYGFYLGSLTCSAACDQVVTAGCSESCGDGIINGPEVCDGTSFGALTCADFGYYGGSLTCAPTCTTIDATATCVGTCGDGTVNGGEVCDASDFGGATCADFGFYSGTLTCAPTCDASDQTACVGYCGDGVVNGAEICDDGNTADCDGCRGDCSVVETGCGDGFLCGAEACDDGNPANGDGCDATCLVEEAWGCVGEPSACYNNPGPGEVIVTEILYDTSTFAEPDGEWLEVQNVSSATLVLTNCTVSDGEGDFTLDDVLLAPGAFAVLAHTDNSGVTGWVPDFVYGGVMSGSFALANSGDEVTLTCPDGAGGNATLDVVIYYSSSPFPAQQAGTAIALDPLIQNPDDNDHGGHWCLAGTAYGGGELGTPGTANALCDDTIDWCRLQFPPTVNTTAGTPFTVYARVYEAGITDETTFTDPSEAILAEIGYGADGSDPTIAPGSWTWVSAIPNLGYDGAAAGEPNNDEYQADVAIGAAGTYDYAARFSRDGGLTWIYCDLDDSANGYQIAQAGDAVIN